MRTFITYFLLCLSGLYAQDPASTIIRCYYPGGGFCSGVCVSDSGLVMTAKHCGTEPMIYCGVPGYPERIMAVKVGESPAAEGAMCYDMEGDGYPFMPIASKPPKVGDQVWSMGYPRSGSLQRDSGAITGHIYDGLFTASLDGVWPGWSGGPLFNQDNKVVGLLSAFDAQPDIFGNLIEGSATESYWIDYDDVSMVYAQAQIESVRIVVFTLPGCGPCQTLKRHYAEGRFPGFTMEFKDYSTNQELFAEFKRECAEEIARTVKGDFAVPLIWRPGTGKFIMGYDTGRPIIDFLTKLKNLIAYGPAPYIRKDPLDPVLEPTPAPRGPDSLSVESLKEAVSELKKDKETLQEAVQKLSEGIATLRSADASKGEKLDALLDLKNTVGTLVETTKEVKEKAEVAVDTAKNVSTDPLGYLWGLLSGMIPGLFYKELLKGVTNA